MVKNQKHRVKVFTPWDGIGSSYINYSTALSKLNEQKRTNTTYELVGIHAKVENSMYGVEWVFEGVD